MRDVETAHRVLTGPCSSSGWLALLDCIHNRLGLEEWLEMQKEAKVRNRELIARFEQKLQAKLAEMWGEE